MYRFEVSLCRCYTIECSVSSCPPSIQFGQKPYLGVLVLGVWGGCPRTAASCLWIDPLCTLSGMVSLASQTTSDSPIVVCFYQRAVQRICVPEGPSAHDVWLAIWAACAYWAVPCTFGMETGFWKCWRRGARSALVKVLPLKRAINIARI